jgi:hypothetical protein
VIFKLVSFFERISHNSGGDFAVQGTLQSLWKNYQLPQVKALDSQLAETTRPTVVKKESLQPKQKTQGKSRVTYGFLVERLLLKTEKEVRVIHHLEGQRGGNALHHTLSYEASSSEDDDADFEKQCLLSEDREQSEATSSSGRGHHSAAALHI